MVDRISAEAGALVAGAQAAVEAKQDITQRVVTQFRPQQALHVALGPDRPLSVTTR